MSSCFSSPDTYSVSGHYLEMSSDQRKLFVKDASTSNTVATYELTNTESEDGIGMGVYNGNFEFEKWAPNTAYSRSYSTASGQSFDFGTGSQKTTGIGVIDIRDCDATPTPPYERLTYEYGLSGRCYQLFRNTSSGATVISMEEDGSNAGYPPSGYEVEVEVECS